MRVFARRLLVPALIGLVSSCSLNRPDALAGAMRATDQDSAIVEAAAAEFMQSGDCWEGFAKDGIVVSARTLSASVLSRLRLGELSSDEWGDIAPGLAKIRERNENGRLIDWHFSDSERIRDVVLTGIEADAIDKAARYGKCVTFFALPAVANDGRTAIVVFDVAPEYHGRTIICRLRLVGGAWRVEGRHNFEFL